MADHKEYFKNEITFDTSHTAKKYPNFYCSEKNLP